MRPTRLLVLLVLAHVLLSACAKLTPEQAKKLQNIWKDSKKAAMRARSKNGRNAAAAAKGHRVGQKADSGCENLLHYKWENNGGCQLYTSEGALPSNRVTKSDDGKNTKIWGFTAETVSIPGGSSYSYELDIRGSSFEFEVPDAALDADVRITVQERKADGFTWMAHADPSSDPNDPQFYVNPVPGTAYPYWSGGEGRWRIIITYWPTADSPAPIDLSPLVLRLNCWDPVQPEDPHADVVFLPFDTDKGTCDTVCWPGYHMMPGTFCLEYAQVFETQGDIVYDNSGPNPGSYLWHLDGVFDLNAVEVKTFILPSYDVHTEVFTISASSTPSNNFYVFVGEIGLAEDENGDLTDAFNIPHGELRPPFEATTFKSNKAEKGSGLWLVFVANWDTAGLSGVDGSFLSGTLKCDGNRAFEGPFTYPDGHLLSGLDLEYQQCAAPLPDAGKPGVCAYSALGFNPFERWNVFSGADSTFDAQTTVEGSVASVGKVEFKGAAEIHTVKEKHLKSPNVWSVQAGSVVITGAGTNAEVKNGGVETSGAAAIAAEKVEGEIKQNAALSVDLAAAKQYFITRSMEWSEQPDNVVDKTLGNAENPFEDLVNTLTLRLHGKVNFVTITSTEFSDIRQIILTGHPVGTVVINVAGDTAITERQNRLFVLYQNAERKLKQPVFGRVLFNFFEQTTNVIDLGFLQGAAKRKAATQIDNLEDSTVCFSVLAPFASVRLSSALRGNIIAGKDFKAPAYQYQQVKLQPFGTTAKTLGQPRAPKAWTASGRRAVSCLWQQL